MSVQFKVHDCSRKSARQATIIIKFYTRSAGGAVSVAGVALQVNVKIILKFNGENRRVVA